MNFSEFTAQAKRILRQVQSTHDSKIQLYVFSRVLDYLRADMQASEGQKEEFISVLGSMVRELDSDTIESLMMNLIASLNQIQVSYVILSFGSYLMYSYAQRSSAKKLLLRICNSEFLAENAISLCRFLSDLDLDCGDLQEKCIKNLLMALNLIDAADLPDFVHSLLQLAKKKSKKLIFNHLLHYFSTSTERLSESALIIIVSHVVSYLRSNEWALKDILKYVKHNFATSISSFMLFLVFTALKIPSIELPLGKLLSEVLLASLEVDVKKEKLNWIPCEHKIYFKTQLKNNLESLLTPAIKELPEFLFSLNHIMLQTIELSKELNCNNVDFFNWIMSLLFERFEFLRGSIWSSIIDALLRAYENDILWEIFLNLLNNFADKISVSSDVIQSFVLQMLDSDKSIKPLAIQVINCLVQKLPLLEEFVRKRLSFLSVKQISKFDVEIAQDLCMNPQIMKWCYNLTKEKDLGLFQKLRLDETNSEIQGVCIYKVFIFLNNSLFKFTRMISLKIPSLKYWMKLNWPT